MDGPLPPTPHMRACLGSWRTMSSYTLATVSAVVSKAQGRTHSLSRDDMQGDGELPLVVCCRHVIDVMLASQTC